MFLSEDGKDLLKNMSFVVNVDELMSRIIKYQYRTNKKLKSKGKTTNIFNKTCLKR